MLVLFWRRKLFGSQHWSGLLWHAKKPHSIFMEVQSCWETQSLRLVFNFVIPIKTLWQKDRKRYNNFYTEWSGFASQERSKMLRALCWINISSDFPLFHFGKHHKCIYTPYLTSLLHIIISTEIWIRPCRVCRSGGWYIVSCNWHFSQWKL